MYRYYPYKPTSMMSRMSKIPPPPPPIPPPPPKPPKPPLPKKKKKLDFKCIKKDTCKSLNDVEHFLCDFNSFVRYLKLYKLMKK